jgi:sulfhydrogenase subunit delta
MAGPGSDDSHRPRMAVWKFASCDGCQLSLLNCEDELLALAGVADIAHFTEASSASAPGPYDLSLVEGSITTPEDAERIQRVRQVSRRLVTIGACATSGGIQALRSLADIDELRAAVYPRPELLSTLADSTPISAHVPVDFELHGCPVDRAQLLEVVVAEMSGRTPRIPAETVCVECKLRGNVCVLVASGTPCLGPVTQAGCGALCPAHDRGCYGCFGPAPWANLPSLTTRLSAGGMEKRDLVRVLRTFNAGAPIFREEAERHDAQAGR